MMDQWVGQVIAVEMQTRARPLQGKLIKADYNGDIIMEIFVGSNLVPSKCFIPDRSYDMVYLVPEGAVFNGTPKDNWAGVEANG